jgi:chromate transporter
MQLDASPKLKPSTLPDVAMPVSFWQAFAFWLKMGFVSFGGPAAQIALMHQELVERKRWISDARFVHALNYCMLLPGPEAQQLATYIGWLMHRTVGGIVAGALFVLPSLLILIGLSWVYIAWGHVPWIAGVFYGIKPAVAALVFQAAHRLGSRILSTPLMWAVASLAFIGMAGFNAPFPLIIGLAALLGYAAGRYWPAQFQTSGAHRTSSTAFGPALIDNETPTPAHAQFKWSRLVWVLIAGAGLWALPMFWMWSQWGWSHTYTQLSWFFTKAALLTFGGAYAVLPYVYQGAVENHAWLSAAQMMDGLALGESTPGPLIMVVAFVGFVTAYTKTLLGANALIAAGVLGACLVTWFTFLPSFIFILAGGPLIESTHRNLKFTAPLSAISAAVVGVILNLALFFVYHVVWPQGFGLGHFGEIDRVAALLTAAALFALVRLKWGVIPVLAISALLGLLSQTI